jgi:chromosome partitioning protein
METMNHMSSGPTSTVRTVSYPPAIKILVANAKGGCGKTTLTTNLACQFARIGETTMLIDHDPQGSATDWLALRSKRLPIIDGIAATRERHRAGSTLSWRMRLTPSTQRVVIDTPAGLHGNELSDLVAQADIILIPVIPSAIDMRAVTEFIADLMKCQAYRQKAKPIAVVANRVKRNTLSFGALKKFLDKQHIPFIASLRDTQFYVRAGENGFGVVDFDRQHAKEQEEWRPLMRWLNTTISEITAANN